MQEITTKVCRRKVTKLCATSDSLGDNDTILTSFSQPNRFVLQRLSLQMIQRGFSFSLFFFDFISFKTNFYSFFVSKRLEDILSTFSLEVLRSDNLLQTRAFIVLTPDNRSF